MLHPFETLQDSESLAERELMASLIVAAGETDRPVIDAEIDRIVGVTRSVWDTKR